jgi:tetratricopeptide (TPR) repeat protein
MSMRNLRMIGRAIGRAALLLACLAGIASGQDNLGQGRVAGTVVDEAGLPIAGVQIAAQSLRSPTTTLSATTDRKGHFAIAGFGTGTWRITASKDGYEASLADLDVRQLRANPPVHLTLRKISDVAATTDDQATQRDLNQANQLYTAGEFAEAALLYEAVAGQHPQLYAIHLNIGTCYLKLQDWEKAKARFQAVLDRTSQPDGTYKDAAAAGKAFVGLGEASARSDDLPAAKTYFDQALKLAPEDETTAYNVAEILFSTHRVEEAIGYYEMALRIRKDWPKAAFKLGLACLNQGDYDRALEYLNRFVEMDPQDPSVPQAREMILTIQRIKK